MDKSSKKEIINLKGLFFVFFDMAESAGGEEDEEEKEEENGRLAVIVTVLRLHHLDYIVIGDTRRSLWDKAVVSSGPFSRKWRNFPILRLFTDSQIEPMSFLPRRVMRCSTPSSSPYPWPLSLSLSLSLRLFCGWLWDRPW